MKHKKSYLAQGGSRRAQHQVVQETERQLSLHVEGLVRQHPVDGDVRLWEQ